MYVVLLIYRGALRRRMRRLVRPRVFNNARTASRNRDLAIRAPLNPLLPTPWADSGQCMAATTVGFLASAGAARGLAMGNASRSLVAQAATKPLRTMLKAIF